MRKFAKVIVIIASSLVGIGIICLVLSVAFGGTGIIFGSSGNLGYKTHTATFDEVEIIDINDMSNDVKILPTDSSEVKVTYSESEHFGYYITQSDKTLKIDYEDFREWYEFIGIFSLRNSDLTVEVPRTALEKLSVKTVSGSIYAKEILAAETLLTSTSGRIEAGGSMGVTTLKTTSGDIQLNSNTMAESVSAESVSGELRLSGDCGGVLEASATSGDINFSGCFATDAKLYATSGDIEAEALYLANLEAETMSGDVNLSDTTCAYDMKIKTVSGEIELEYADAANYNLSSTSGDIDALLLTAKTCNVSTTSGSIDVPQNPSSAEGTFTAVTTSGDIEVEIVNR